jgi:hypothetical protein
MPAFKDAFSTVSLTVLVYVVSQKWTDASEKGRDSFSHFVGDEKYDFSAV